MSAHQVNGQGPIARVEAVPNFKDYRHEVNPNANSALRPENQDKKQTKSGDKLLNGLSFIKFHSNKVHMSDSEPKTKEKIFEKENEADPDYYRRWFSVFLVWFIMFILVLQFSVYSSTLGTYLPLIDNATTDSFSPFAIAAFGFGQVIGCPLFGWYSNYIKNNRLPMVIGIAFMIAGNVGYSFVELFPTRNLRWLVVAFRFIIGFGAGIAGVIRAYCATATKKTEYVKAVTGATAALAIAIMAGPGVQAMFTPIGYPGVQIGSWHLHMYNAPAVASIFVAVLCLILLYTLLLQKYPGLAKSDNQSKFFVLPKYDMLAIAVIIVCWFASYLTLTSFVMIGKSYTMVMFGWNTAQSVVNNGIIMGIFACISLVIFIIYPYYSHKYEERKLMLVGMAMMSLFFIITFPWPGLPKLQNQCGNYPCCRDDTHGSINQTVRFSQPCMDLDAVSRLDILSASNQMTSILQANERNATRMANTVDNIPLSRDNFPGGCQAIRYDWCEENTREPMGLYLGTFFLLACGFPIANCAFSALYSKVLGPRRQGLMQGIIISSGALSRSLGPLFINYSFDWWGPRCSWGLTAGLLILSIILNSIFFRRLIPLNPKPALKPGEYFRYKRGLMYRF